MFHAKVDEVSTCSIEFSDINTNENIKINQLIDNYISIRVETDGTSDSTFIYYDDVVQKHVQGFSLIVDVENGVQIKEDFIPIHVKVTE